MKKITSGTKVPYIELPSIDGNIVNTSKQLGRPYMISFFRFASCPFCNLRLHDLVTRVDEFGDDFTIIAIFDSSLENLQRHATKHRAPFPILADASNKYYQQFSIEHSLLGMLKGIAFRLPRLIKGLAKGYIPLVPNGSMTTMPAEFLINRQGIVETAFYGKDEGDHLPLEQIIEFSKHTA